MNKIIELYLGKTRLEWVTEFGRRMNKLDYGTPEYEKCRKIYAWLCEKVRIEQKLNGNY